MMTRQQSGLATGRAPHHIAIGAVALLTLCAKLPAQTAFTSPPPADQLLSSTASLPDAPSALLEAAEAGSKPLPPCPIQLPPAPPSTMPAPPPATPPAPCEPEHPFRIVINQEQRTPLSSGQKGMLAIRDVTDPFNLTVIAIEAGAGVTIDPHSAYGPGFKGFGRLFGYAALQDAQGEFFGTFLIPSLAHQDPRYRRMQNATVKRRILHALAHTVIAQHDDGSNMPNYATLFNYPISAELSNLYVPGLDTRGPATARRIAIGFATDPAGNLIAEFLPDIARRIHVRSVFIQQIVNQMATDASIGQ